MRFKCTGRRASRWPAPRGGRGEHRAAEGAHAEKALELTLVPLLADFARVQHFRKADNTQGQRPAAQIQYFFLHWASTARHPSSDVDGCSAVRWCHLVLCTGCGSRNRRRSCDRHAALFRCTCRGKGCFGNHAPHHRRGGEQSRVACMSIGRTRRTRWRREQLFYLNLCAKDRSVKIHWQYHGCADRHVPA